MYRRGPDAGCNESSAALVQLEPHRVLQPSRANATLCAMSASRQGTSIVPIVLCIALLCAASACRDAQNGSASSALPIAVNHSGANGCSGPNAAITAGSTPATIALTVLH